MKEYNVGKFLIIVTPDEVTNAVFAAQKHGATIVESTEIKNQQTPADGMIVRLKGPAAGIYTADCLPLALVNDEAAAALHVSRKSSAAGLLESARDVFKHRRPHTAFVGPHACAEHLTYEYMGKELQAFTRRFPAAVTQHGGLTHVSLKKAVMDFLTAWLGDLPKIIEDGRCTVEDTTLCSYRRHLAQGRAPATLGRITTVLYPLSASRRPDTGGQHSAN